VWHVLSIARVRNARYYINLAAGDYYLKGGEPPGEWWGEGAKALGLTGTVIRRHFLGLLRGFSPTGKKLRRNAGTKNKKKDRPGFDLTFTPPKSISLLWALCPEHSTRLQIQDCQRDAVKRVLRLIEDELTFIRKGKGGASQVPGKLAVALFEHGTSRANEPLIHTHAIIPNVAFAAGETGALDASLLYQPNMNKYLDALQKIELGFLLRRSFRIEFDRVKSWFEVRGISQTLIDFFSTRRVEVLAEQKRTGNKGARSAAVAAQKTRRPKDHKPRAELLRQWKEQAQGQGADLEAIARSCVPRPKDEADKLFGEQTAESRASQFQAKLKNLVTNLAEQKSHFSFRDLVRASVTEAVMIGLSVSEVLDTVKRTLAEEKDIVLLGVHEGEERFATDKTLRLEAELLSIVEELGQERGALVPDSVRHEVLAQARDLSDEQWRAYNHLLTPESRIKVLSGLPGTGKSTVLEPCVKAWKKAGYRIIGAAIAGKAARNLQQKSGMDSYTVERLKMDLDATFLDNLDHHLVQLNRWTSGKPTYNLNRLKLDKHTILVVDEAGMLDTQNAANLLRHAKESGATLVLAGDREQLLPVGAGAPYAVIEERIQPAELEMIRRQRLSVDVEAIHSFRDGKVREVFDDFKNRGLLHVDQTRNDSLKRVVDDWARLGGVTNPEKHLIMVQTNESRGEANKACRQERLLRGTVEAGGITFGEDTISKGDQIIFLRNSNMEPVARPPIVGKPERVKVRNGDLATVVAIGGPPFAKTVVAQLHEGGEKVRFALSDYRDIALGYAVTVHKFQGSDVANALWLAETKNLSKELGYTAITRHVQSLHIYANELDAGKKLEHLERKLRTSAREPLAYELFQRHVAQMQKDADDLDNLPPRPTLHEDEPTPSVERALARMMELREDKARTVAVHEELPVDVKPATEEEQTIHAKPVSPERFEELLAKLRAKALQLPVQQQDTLDPNRHAL